VVVRVRSQQLREFEGGDFSSDSDDLKVSQGGVSEIYTVIGKEELLIFVRDYHGKSF
jgi:hypothetical protein